MSGTSWARLAVVIAAGAIAASVVFTPSWVKAQRRKPTLTPTVTPSSTPAAEIKSWDFDQDRPDAVASGWQALEGDWKVIPDATAPSQPNTFGLLPGRLFSSLTHLLEYYPMAIVKDPTEYSDFTLEADFKPVKGRFDCSGGLLFRYVDAQDFYVIAVGCPSDYLQMIRVYEGKSDIVRQSVVPTDINTWYHLMVQATGDRFVVHDNKKLVFDASDSSIGKGRIGLWASNDSQARFDNVTLTVPLPAGTAGATSVPGKFPPLPPPP